MDRSIEQLIDQSIDDVKNYVSQHCS